RRSEKAKDEYEFEYGKDIFNRDEGDKGDTGNPTLPRRHSGQSRKTIYSRLFPSLEGRGLRGG
ncbi:MAG: hypothetical protein MUO68_00310, partial [Desulfobacteraceae bacterium]|nr:hypothetical protein [Desulfobacteraceae bacterium]